jgi:hypothetical protein
MTPPLAGKSNQHYSEDERSNFLENVAMHLLMYTTKKYQDPGWTATAQILVAAGYFFLFSKAKLAFFSMDTGLSFLGVNPLNAELTLR